MEESPFPAATTDASRGNGPAPRFSADGAAAGGPAPDAPAADGHAAAAVDAAAFGGAPPAFAFAAAPEPPDVAVLAGGAFAVFPPLHTPGARTVQRDRWERLGTEADVPQPPEAVWAALTDPAALRLWLAAAHGRIGQPGSETTLDFEDGEFFHVRTLDADPPRRLAWLWRWMGAGQATRVTWELEAAGGGTRIRVHEDALNPPWDWQSWNGGGWPGILDQLAAYLRTGTEWRWPWRRFGPYAQVELPVPFFEAWYRLLAPSGARFWMQVMEGDVAAGRDVQILMGDASGGLRMSVREVVEPGQRPPSFLPSVDFSVSRPAWGGAQVGGRIWMEPAGWGRSLLQVVHWGWEAVPAGLQLSERRLVAAFWAGAVRRAAFMCGAGQARPGAHGWS